MPLTEMLKDSDYDVRYAATEALGIVRDPRAVRPLIAALKHENPDVREAAAEALGRSADDWALEPLMAVLNDSRFSVQMAAARALGALGERAVPTLTRALRADPEWNVRYVAAIALGLVASEHAVRPLIDALEDDDSRVRWSAADALNKIGTEEALAATRQWRSGQDAVWDYVDVGNERRTLEAETGQLPGARVYRLVPLKEQRLRERDRLAISGTITCASCGRSTAVTDIEVTLRRTLFDEGLVHTWTCPQCENHTIISAFITTNGDAERAYWLAVQRDSDPMNSGPAMGWPTLTIDTLSSGSFEQVFAPR